MSFSTKHFRQNVCQANGFPPNDMEPNKANLKYNFLKIKAGMGKNEFFKKFLTLKHE
jgi:hypothetical protein